MCHGTPHQGAADDKGEHHPAERNKDRGSGEKGKLPIPGGQTVDGGEARGRESQAGLEMGEGSQLSAKGSTVSGRRQFSGTSSRIELR